MTDTTAWRRNKSDDLAVENGCWFDVMAGSYVVWWIERYCRLYEGEWAGEALVLHSVADEPQWPMPDRFYADDGEPDPAVVALYRERARWHNQQRDSGGPIHWQYECVMRLFGWQRQSSRWKRPVRRYRRGSVFVSKKNGKSPTASSILLYLVAGDGESGSKVFIASKDSKQAGIIWQHSYEMIMSSPELKAEFRVNRTTKRLTHEPTRSFAEPLSSSNSRTMDAKEGINGHVLVDETHVVDRGFMSILEGAGISRVQPMHLEVSTAGKNVNGYGHEQWEYGQKVESGEIKDDAFFFASYHMPQDITEATLLSDPEKYLRMANPSWGHTIDPEEILSTLHKSRASRYSYQKFLMYRGNIWQSTIDVWGASSGWKDCGHDISLDDYGDQPCVIGLDLARKFDLAGAVVAFRNDDGSVDIFPFAWTSIEVAKSRAPQVPQMLDWIDSGELVAGEGDVMDFQLIERDLYALCKRLNVRGIVYDSTYAEDITSVLQSGRTNPDTGEQLVEGLGVARMAMSQGYLTQAGPTVDFENEVQGKKLRHPNHGVLNWQMTHATTKADSNGNIKILKPGRQDIRTVDVVQAAIMARWGALDCQEWTLEYGTYYEDNPMEFA